MGPVEVARAFAERWASLVGVAANRADRGADLRGDGGRAAPRRRRCDAPVRGVRSATRDRLDACLLRRGNARLARRARRAVRRRPCGGDRLARPLGGRGRTVSLAGHAGETPNGARVGPVYTPPELRGRGYASALTASLTERLLERRRFCFLFTDLANPTSNSIYQRIGYRARHRHHALAVRPGLSRRQASAAAAIEAAAATAAARPDTWAPGSADTIRAHVVMYTATQPFTQASATASAGATGATAAAENESPSSNGTAGSTSAFATTP